MKKVPKTDKADPKRVKKALPKIVKTMKPDDRVMIIGVTKSPFGELLYTIRTYNSTSFFDEFHEFCGF